MADGDSTGRISRAASDPRLDKIGAWLITFLATLAVGYLGNQVSTLNAKLDVITVKIAVVEAGRYGEAIEKLEGRIRELERTGRSGGK